MKKDEMPMTQKVLMVSILFSVFVMFAFIPSLNCQNDVKLKSSVLKSSVSTIAIQTNKESHGNGNNTDNFAPTMLSNTANSSSGNFNSGTFNSW